MHRNDELKEVKTKFEQHIKDKYTPINSDRDGVNWAFEYQCYDHKSTIWLKSSSASRDLQPEDFVAHPQLFRPFVLSLKKQISEAQRIILWQGQESAQDDAQRARELVDALKRANEILAPLFE